jgi:Putative adhesin
MIRILTLLLGVSCLLLADEQSRQKVQVTNTQHLDLPPSGTVTFKNSTGELTIEGWDQPGVEITTVKSTKAAYSSAEREKGSRELEKVQVAAERHGDEVVITTTSPHHGFPVPTDVDLDYRVKVPRAARLVVKHGAGEVHFDDVTGDIHATASKGAITLHVPAGDQYAIDAKSRIGSVTSDFPGSMERRWLVGHQFVQTSQAPHKLYLRTGFGDVIILKIQKPEAPK